MDKSWAKTFSKPLLHLFLIALIGILAYSNTFNVPFVFDDESSIVNNPVLRELSNFLPGGAGYSYNPRRFIGYLSFALNYRLGGLNPAGYHLFNLCIHLISGWLVLSLCRMTMATPFCQARFSYTSSQPGSPKRLAYVKAFIPLLAALLFVAHPVQTQAVTYVVQRLASLATMWYLLGIVLYVKARLSQESEHNPFSATALICYLFCLLAAGLAMKTKEISFTLPIVVMLYEFFFFQLNLRKKLLLLAPVALTILVVPLSLLGTSSSLSTLVSDISNSTRVETTLSRGDYLFTQSRVIITYLRLLLLPVRQNLDYDYPVYRSFLAPQVLFSFMFLSSLFVLALYLFRRSRRGGEGDVHARLVSFGILWFFITLSVESSLIPIADVIFEHRLYLPSVGAFLVIAAAADLLMRRLQSRQAVAISLSVVLVLCVATWYRNLAWSDAVTLAQDTASKSPNKARAHFNLALALSKKGQLGPAIAEARTAARLDPYRPDVRCQLGSLYGRAGLMDQAQEQLRLAVSLDPKSSEAHSNLGAVYKVKGLMDQALEEYQVALGLKPDNPELLNEVGMACGAKGDYDLSVSCFQRAVQLRPDNAGYRYNLAKVNDLLGKKLVRLE